MEFCKLNFTLNLWRNGPLLNNKTIDIGIDTKSEPTIDTPIDHIYDKKCKNVKLVTIYSIYSWNLNRINMFYLFLETLRYMQIWIFVWANPFSTTLVDRLLIIFSLNANSFRIELLFVVSIVIST